VAKAIALALSLVIHLVILAFALKVTTKQARKPYVHTEVSLSEPPVKLWKAAKPGEDEEGNRPGAIRQVDCPPHLYRYTGIGISHAHGGWIEYVGDNTPAQAAGISVGDIIENVEILEQNRYQVGEVIELRIRRGAEARNVRVTIAQICQQ
jgi:predicted metalloprotease with PDZ domain